jgi:hypothetical protein
LRDNEPGGTLLAWLNGLPETRAVLAREFAGQAISKQNLSEWRAGGHAEWLARQETLAQAGDLAADAAELAAATDGRLSDHVCMILTARYAGLLGRWDGELTEDFRRRLRALRGVCQDVVELRRGDHSGARLRLEQERLERERERTEEEVLAHFQRWVETPAVREAIGPRQGSPEARARRFRQLFGRPPREEHAVPSGESNPVRPSQTEIPAPEASGPGPMPGPGDSGQTGSNPVKPTPVN